MEKFIIFSTGRTGSTVGAFWLADWLANKYNISDPSSIIKLSTVEDINDWSFPLYHTHNHLMLGKADNSFRKIISRRNIFDSVLSIVIANHTKVYHIVDSDDQITVDQYQDQFKDTKIKIDVDDFVIKLNGRNSFSQKAIDTARVNSEITFIDYGIILQGYNKFLNQLGLDAPETETHMMQFNQLPVNKYSMVENLNELLLAYKDLELSTDIEVDETIGNIELFLNLPKSS